MEVVNVNIAKMMVLVMMVLRVRAMRDDNNPRT